MSSSHHQSPNTRAVSTIYLTGGYNGSSNKDSESGAPISSGPIYPHVVLAVDEAVTRAAARDVANDGDQFGEEKNLTADGINTNSDEFSLDLSILSSSSMQGPSPAVLRNPPTNKIIEGFEGLILGK